jgi:plasmid stability protein
MPTLQVRNLPDHIYKRIAALARAKSSSITKETIYLLEKSLQVDEVQTQQKYLLINKMLDNAPKNSEQLIDPAILIREDRDR